jgi:predicted phage terminase large subunit-like protein
MAVRQYRPAGPVLAGFHDAAKAGGTRVAIGPVSGGRATAAVMELLGRTIQQARAGGGACVMVRVVVMTPTVTELDEKVIPTWHAVVPATEGRFTTEANERRHLVPLLSGDRCPDGELEVIFLAWERAEHRRRLAAIDATWVWLANARALPEEAYDEARAAASGNYPAPGQGADPDYYGVVVTSRMPPAGHWLLTRADPDIQRFRQPGGRTGAGENLANLPKGFYERLAHRYRNSPERVAADVDAEIAGSAAATAAEASRAAARASLTEFVRVAMPDIEPAAHHQLIIAKLEAVARGETKRLMLSLPPGSAKSTYASILFPPWWMGNHPALPVIAASHSKELAERFGRRVRNIVGSPGFADVFGFGLSGDSGAAGRWETARGGEYFAVGVDASVTGRRCALGIIDDPVKGRAEADSPTVRQHVWDWYKSDFWTRLIPDAAIIYIGTRWHDDDLAGRLLEEAKSGGEQWEIVSLPMLAENNDPLGRAAGERLWPEWFTEEMVAIARRDPRNWSALYQQQPMPESGDYFKAEWFKWYDTAPPREQLRTYGASDYATKQQGGDFTVHLVVGLDPGSNIYLLDLYREQSSPDKWIDPLLDLMARWKTITWAEEAGQIKNSVGPFITKRQLERRIHAVRRQFTSSSDKPSRAQAIRGRAGMGMVYLPRNAPWAVDFVHELLRFPAGTHDDQVDAFSLIGRMLDEMVPGAQPKVRPDPLRDPANLDPRLYITLDRIGTRPNAPSLWSTAPGGANDPYKREYRRI